MFCVISNLPKGPFINYVVKRFRQTVKTSRFMMIKLNNVVKKERDRHFDMFYLLGQPSASGIAGDMFQPKT